MIKLSNRLQVIYDLIPNCDTLADVGCDHGYLSIAVIEGHLASKVIAMDINKGPLESAKSNVIAESMQDSIELRLSDGLCKLSPHEADVICICGMGGVLMKRIIHAGIEVAKSAKYLILEPQSEVHELRAFLNQEGFVFEAESIVTEENKIYPVFKVYYTADESARQELSEVELEYGPCLLQQGPQLLYTLLEKRKSEYSDIKSNLETKITDTNKALPILNRLETLNHELYLIDEAYSILGRVQHGKGNC